MKQQEQARIQVLNSVLEHHLPIAQAAEIMGISERHTKRLLAAYRKDGPAAVAHGNRGRRPHNAVPEDAAAAVLKLASNGYAGANHSNLTELLREREGIDLSRPMVRRILARAGMGSPRSRRSPQHRFRRRRMPQEGMLVRVDGSSMPGWKSEDPSWYCSWRWMTPPGWWARRSSAPARTPVGSVRKWGLLRFRLPPKTPKANGTGTLRPQFMTAWWTLFPKCLGVRLVVTRISIDRGGRPDDASNR